VYKGSFFPHSCQHLLLFVFLMLAILSGMRWNLSVILICISFIVKDVEHFFMYLFMKNKGHCTSFRTVCSSLLPVYWLNYLFLVFMFWSSLFRILILYLMNHWQRFSPICKFSLDSGNCFLRCTEAFWFDTIPVVNSCSYFLSNWSQFRKALLMPPSSMVSHLFSFSSFKVFKDLYLDICSILNYFCTEWETGV
jgi:hypothetical protein